MEYVHDTIDASIVCSGRFLIADHILIVNMTGLVLQTLESMLVDTLVQYTT